MRIDFSRYPLREVAPEWRVVADALHRLLSLYACANWDPQGLRLLVPLDFPPPYPNAETPAATLFMVPVQYTAAVTVPVLGHVLDVQWPASTLSATVGDGDLLSPTPRRGE